MLRVLLSIVIVLAAGWLGACRPARTVEFDSLTYLIEHGRTPEEAERVRASLREYPERTNEAVRRMASVVVDPRADAGWRTSILSVLVDYPEQGLPVMESMLASNDPTTEVFVKTAVDEMTRNLAKKRPQQGHPHA